MLATILRACVDSFLSVLVLTTELLNFLFDRILHKMLFLISLGWLRGSLLSIVAVLHLDAVVLALLLITTNASVTHLLAGVWEEARW